MEIEKFKQEVLRVFGEMNKMPKRKIHTKQSAMIHLIEEVGEVAKQVTNEYHRPEKFNKNNLGTELADVMMFMVLLSELYNIDISSEMKEAIKRVEGKIKKIKKKIK
jgi:NTP pyrophosphatase (non-canonical NTP hydrolase)